MPLTVTERNTLADFGAARMVWYSMHTGDPGTTGANEANGGSPAYGRKQATWGASTTGTATAAQLTFDVPAGTYTHFGAWSAATGGTFRGGNALSASQTLASQGQILFTPTYPITAG